MAEYKTIVVAAVVELDPDGAVPYADLAALLNNCQGQGKTAAGLIPLESGQAVRSFTMHTADGRQHGWLAAIEQLKWIAL